MSSPAPPYVLDVPAIKSWAEATGNEAGVVLSAIQAGTIIVYNKVLNSAKGAYPDECRSLPLDDFERRACNEEHRLASAAIADKLQATFPLRGPYDDAIEWTLVGIASSGPCTIVTDDRRKKKYMKINGLAIITYDELIELLQED